jgi:hypothetical protein
MQLKHESAARAAAEEEAVRLRADQDVRTSEARSLEAQLAAMAAELQKLEANVAVNAACAAETKVLAHPAFRDVGRSAPSTRTSAHWCAGHGAGRCGCAGCGAASGVAHKHTRSRTDACTHERMRCAKQARVAITGEASDATRPQPCRARSKRKQREVRSTRAPARAPALVLRLHGHNTVTSFTLIVTRLATKLQEKEEQRAARVTRAKASTSQGSTRSEPEVWIDGVTTLAAKPLPGG